MPRDFYHVCAAIIAYLTSKKNPISCTFIAQFAFGIDDIWSRSPEVEFISWIRLREALEHHYPNDEVLRCIYNDDIHYLEWLPVVPTEWAFLKHGRYKHFANASGKIKCLQSMETP